MTAADNHAARASRRSTHTGATRQQYSTIAIRVTFCDGSTLDGEWIGLSGAVAEHPDAVAVARVDSAGAFY